MPRIRTIKPEFWTSDQIVECSTNARLLFVGMWNFADDSGRHVASVRKLKAEVFPADDLTASEVRRWLDELVEQGLIVEYEAVIKEEYSDRKLLIWQITGWHHQRIDRPRESRYPPPDLDNIRRTIDERSTNDRLVERKGKDRIGKEKTPARSDSEAPVCLIPLIDKTDFAVNPQLSDEWQTAYPGVDVKSTLKKIRAWCVSNPTKRKTKRGVKRFINSWLAREQDRRGQPGNRNATHRPTIDDIREQRDDRLRSQGIDPDTV